MRRASKIGHRIAMSAVPVTPLLLTARRGQEATA
jgi:hypothetical protein